MNCKRIRDLLPLYADEEWQGSEREMVARHLEVCEPCRKRLALDRELAMGLAGLPAPAAAAAMGPAVKEGVMDQVKRQRPGLRRALRTTPWAATVLLTGLLVLVIVLAWKASTGQLPLKQSPATPQPAATLPSEATPSPVAAECPPCVAQDLEAVAPSQIAGGSLVGEVQVTNRGLVACSVQGRPRLYLLDAQGQEVEGIQVAPARGQGDDGSPVILQPGAIAGARFSWNNWCGAAPSGPLSLRVELPLPQQGTLPAPLLNRAGQPLSDPNDMPSCKNPEGESTLLAVGPFEAIEAASAEMPTVEIQIYFTDRNRFNTGTQPFDVAVSRQVPATANLPAAVLAAYFQAPTAEERAQGLEAITSGFTGFDLQVENGIARVYLQGPCISHGASYTIASPLIKNLLQFEEIQYVKIYDADGLTSDPEGPTNSIPPCLEP